MKIPKRVVKIWDAVEKSVRAFGCFPAALLTTATVVVGAELATGPGLAATAYAAVVGLLMLIVGRTWRHHRADRTAAELERVKQYMPPPADSTKTTALPLLSGDELTRVMPVIRREEGGSQ